MTSIVESNAMYQDNLRMAIALMDCELSQDHTQWLKTPISSSLAVNRMLLGSIT